MAPHFNSKKGSEGMALFLVLGYLTAMTILAAVFVSALHHSLKRQDLAEKRLIASSIAEGGLSMALTALAADPGYRGVKNLPLGDGRFTVQVAQGAERGEYRITSSGELMHEGFILHRVDIEARASFSGGTLTRLTWSERIIRSPSRKESPQ